jgi:hypothetical protein
MNRSNDSVAPALRVAFLSQCNAFPKYVEHEATYPEQVRYLIEAERPGRRILTEIVPFWYPYENHLRVKLGVALRRHPDVLVVEIPAGPVVQEHIGNPDLRRFPRGIRSAYQRALYLRALGRNFLNAYPLGRELVSVIDWSINSIVDGPLRGLVRRHPREGLATYEDIVEAAVSSIVAQAGPAVVLVGPGGFDANEGDRGWSPETPENYRAVNELTRRVAAKHGLPFVDRVGAADAEKRRFFQQGSATHYSQFGHRLLAQEIADTLLKSGLI